MKKSKSPLFFTPLRAFGFIGWMVVIGAIFAIFQSRIGDMDIVSAVILGEFLFIIMALFLIGGNYIARHKLSSRLPTLYGASVSAIAAIVGAFVGAILGLAVLDYDILNFLHSQPYLFFGSTLFAALGGFFVATIFIFRESMAITKTLIQEERLKRVASEREVVKRELKLLQAQIEPHFLFNTLSNVLSLIDTDLDKGRSMLTDFIQYLRTSLSRSREEIITIGQEMEMISTYLNIFKVRMGKRMSYSIHIPDEMKDIDFPPMLIQPLVENAIKHGLEPVGKGGEIRINGKITEKSLSIEVVNTGAGFYENSDPGMGISNIVDRLQSIYGDRGRLTLKENQPSGLKVIIEVPYERD